MNSKGTTIIPFYSNCALEEGNLNTCSKGLEISVPKMIFYNVSAQFSLKQSAMSHMTVVRLFYLNDLVTD